MLAETGDSPKRNPGGVRIGTAGIYPQAEQLAEIRESLVTGRQGPGDIRVVQFLRRREGLELDDTLRQRIRRTGSCR